MKKTIFLAVIIIAVNQNSIFAQEECNLDTLREEIYELMKIHKSSLQKGISPLFDFYLESDNQQKNILKLPGRQVNFHYMGNRTLRFYVISSGLKSQLQLYQRNDMMLLHEIKVYDVSEEISVFDYEISEANDFVLKFDSVFDSDGCAVAIVTVLSPDFGKPDF